MISIFASDSVILGLNIICLGASRAQWMREEKERERERAVEVNALFFLLFRLFGYVFVLLYITLYSL